ncbi:MAG: glycosyltransferase family 2 protein [Phycisphaerae bacterium]|nr:glycosyltransferase family 2 protein [Saprospiraceae bacterium]
MVSIITVNYNETTTTCALLDSIRRQGYRDVEVIVVDNASRENPASIFQSQYPEAKFIRSEQNLGFAGGNNLALPQACGEYLFFVNNDAEIEPGCIEQLLQLFENQTNVGIVSPLICYFPTANVHSPPSSAKATAGKPSTIQYAGMTPVCPFTGRNRTLGERDPDQGQFTKPSQTAYAHGAAMMVPRKVLEKVGPMWEGFFLYYEELDWCERIRRAGYEIWVEPRARVWHKESLTLDKMGTTKTYYLTRNRILFMRRNFSGWRLAVFYVFLLLVTLPKNCLSYILKGDYDNLKAFLRGLFSNFRSTTNFPKV